MKHRKRFFLLASGYLLCFALCGCAAIKEMGKGFVGVSTQVLEQKRAEALKKSFALGHNDCYAKVKDILNTEPVLNAQSAANTENQKPEIYAQDLKKKMIAIYVSSSDTTPVGIFFTEEAGGNTLIEVSSPSTYAKEEIAKRIFTGIDALINPKVEGEKNNVKEEENKVKSGPGN